MIMKRLQQESTWRGLIAVAAAIAIAVNPASAPTVIPAALALMGAINIVKQD